MHIVHLSSELAPIAKVGGLGDVVYSLSKELIRQGHTVEIILPKYDTIDYSKLKNLQVHYRELWSFDGPISYNNTIWSAEIEGIKVLLIEPHHPSYFYSRGKIYGCADDIDRFLYFTRAAMEFLFKSKRNPDSIHLHDWPVAVAATLYKDMYTPLGFKAGGTILTIHNMEHQGKCAPHNLTRIGLRGENYLTPEKYQDNMTPQAINLLKGGIEDANLITTVSPNYSREILTKEGGHGLHRELEQNCKKLTGILNGIDLEFWNPKTDPHLMQNYDTTLPLTKDKMEKILKAKEDNKRHLRNHFGLLPSDTPLIGCITRLVPQKGPELIAQAIRHTIEKKGQFILLGSEYSPEIQQMFLDLKKEFAASKRFALLLDRNESISHLIFAGSDLLTVPSLFEPCGLTQMIALRYGTIPIVRNTGGLADTVFDIDFSSEPIEKRNGFVFDYPDKEEIDSVIDRAINVWNNDSIKWVQMMENALSCDYSWTRSVQQYIALYTKLSGSSEPISTNNKKRKNKAA